MTYGLALALCSAVLLGYPAAAQVSAWRLDPPRSFRSVTWGFPQFVAHLQS